MSKHHVRACLIAKHSAFQLTLKASHVHNLVHCLSLLNSQRKMLQRLLICRLDLMCRKLQPSESQKKLLAEQPDVKLGRTSSSIPAPRPSIDAEGGPPDAVLCAAGTVRGEDYNFHFTGKIKDGKLYVRLNLEYEGDDEGQLAKGGKKTIDFTYDPEGDTPEAIAKEIGDEFSLSSTDRDICAAALKEWLAKESPDSGR